MNMIRHQAVSVHSAPNALGEFAQQGEVDQMIGIVREATSPVVPPLNHVHSDVRDDEAWLSCHIRDNGLLRRRLTEIGV
jgi:hypothetical protein